MSFQYSEVLVGTYPLKEIFGFRCLDMLWYGGRVGLGVGWNIIKMVIGR